MPAISPMLKTREAVSEDGRQPLSPTAVGFLVPLFVVFLFGPFLFVFFLRCRRGTRVRLCDYTAAATKSAAERREDARQKLKEVTHVSSMAAGAHRACPAEESAASPNPSTEKPSSSAISISERDCAICLCTLHAPSPPEPAKLSSKPTVNALGTPAATPTPSSVSAQALKDQEKEEEEILRIKLCGHEFHGECLVSWFVLRKYSCPICRTVYFGCGKKEANEENGAGHRGSNEGGDEESRVERRGEHGAQSTDHGGERRSVDEENGTTRGDEACRDGTASTQ